MKKRFGMILLLFACLAFLALSPAAATAGDAVAADIWEGSRLVGLLITREDLSAHTGPEGVLFASLTRGEAEGETEYSFGEADGLRLICFIAPDETGEDGIVSIADDGFFSVDFEMNEDGSSVNMDAAVCYVPGEREELFFFNPVFLAASGQVFASPGDFMAVSAEMNPPGSSVGQTVRDDRTRAENGREYTDTTVVSIHIHSVSRPVKIRLLQFGGTHELLMSEEFFPGSVPETVVPLNETEYLLLEIEEETPDGGYFVRREVFGRDTDCLNTLSCREDGICLSHYHEILWEQEGSLPS